MRCACLTIPVSYPPLASESPTADLCLCHVPVRRAHRFGEVKASCSWGRPFLSCALCVRWVHALAHAGDASGDTSFAFSEPIFPASSPSTLARLGTYLDIRRAGGSAPDTTSLDAHLHLHPLLAWVVLGMPQPESLPDRGVTRGGGANRNTQYAPTCSHIYMSGAFMRS